MPFKSNFDRFQTVRGTASKYAPFVDILWLLLLGIYVFAGMTIATFHGDEAMQIYMSRDFVTAFVNNNAASLVVNPPYEIDSDSQLRILNGSVNCYAIGLSWQLAGFTINDLPPRPGWEWGLDYATDVSTGHRPSNELMAAARLPSTLFLALSVGAMFALGWQLGKRPLAYFASGLYVINPIVLLNGRRALQEGPMLFFGLLTVLLAILISRELERQGRIRWFWWLALILSGGLGLASKHPTIVFVAAAYGWIFITIIGRVRRLGFKTPRLPEQPEVAKATRPTSLEVSSFSVATGFKPVAWLILSGILTLALFIALSPALWNDPVSRLGDLLAQRQWELEMQTTAQPTGAISLSERIELIVTQPFMTPLQHFEVVAWADAQPIQREVGLYMNSPLSGVQFGPAFGFVLTSLAGLGIVSLCASSLRSPLSGSIAAGIGLWFALVTSILLVNPLPWQRYYLPLIPVATLLAGIGLVMLAQQVRIRVKMPRRIPVAA